MNTNLQDKINYNTTKLNDSIDISIKEIKGLDDKFQSKMNEETGKLKEKLVNLDTDLQDRMNYNTIKLNDSIDRNIKEVKDFHVKTESHLTQLEKSIDNRYKDLMTVVIQEIKKSDDKFQPKVNDIIEELKKLDTDKSSTKELEHYAGKLENYTRRSMGELKISVEQLQSSIDELKFRESRGLDS